MNRANIIFCSFTLFCFLFFSCLTAKKANTVEDECKLISGEIVDMSTLDGCRFLIQLKDSSFLEPINLSEEHQIHKKEICFQYKFKPEIPSICMKGKVVELLKLE